MLELSYPELGFLLSPNDMNTKTIFYIIAWVSVAQCTKVKLKIKQGYLEGCEDLTISKNKYYCFLGIPYAVPPLGNLRFEAPRPGLSWNGVRDATKFGSICIQYATDEENTVIGQEDCLYLNVYTQKIVTNDPAPVIIFIHGNERFVRGSGNDDLYGPKFLLDRNVCLVTFNYRLGPFGFLTLGIKEVPGNAGLKDQVLAFKWVQENIASFGCDPKQVTLYGNGAGSVLVSLHLVSPAASGLFNRAVMSSGSLLCDYASPFEPERRAYALGRQLGYDTKDPYKLINFLKVASSERLVKVSPEIFESDNTSFLLNTARFTPVREKSFSLTPYLTDNPVELLLLGKLNEADVFIGHTEKEELYNTYYDINLILDTYPYYPTKFVLNNIGMFTNPRQQLKISDVIQKKYFGDSTVSLSNIKRFVDYLSVGLQTYPIHEFAELFVKMSKRKLYFYRFDIFDKRNYYGQKAQKLVVYPKSSLGDDMPYVFSGDKYPKVGLKDNEYKYIRLMTTLIANFAKSGNPTAGQLLEVEWPEYRDVNEYNRKYVSIGDDGLEIRNFTGFQNGDLKFWRNLYQEYGVDFKDIWEYKDNDNYSKKASDNNSNYYETKEESNNDVHENRGNSINTYNNDNKFNNDHIIIYNNDNDYEKIDNTVIISGI